MKIKSLIQSVFLILLFSFLALSTAYGYTLGIFSQSKQPSEITEIEAKIAPYKFPVVAFIFDHYILQGSLIMKNAVEELGTNRTYHITLAPDHMSAKQVANGNFDEEYSAFFNDVKKYKIKVLFRTMHEMNGGWYARGGDPENFKIARDRILKLAKDAGLDKDQIQFIFSFNWHDMPAEPGQKQSQTARLVTCTPKTKLKTGCYTREDFYPGDDKVDIIGFSVYNRGKATSSRLRITFPNIIMDSTWNNRYRVLAKNKKLWIDEVGTTAVQYPQAFSFKKSQEIYAKAGFGKSSRLTELSDFVDSKSEIIGMNYFNVDYTDGLKKQLLGEADRKMLDTQKGMMYNGGRDVLKKNDTLDVALVFDKYIAKKTNDKILAKQTSLLETGPSSKSNTTKVVIEKTNPNMRTVKKETTTVTTKKKRKVQIKSNAIKPKTVVVSYQGQNTPR